MKLPADVSADRLVRALGRIGYRVIRQRGSHIRLRHDGPPAHSISIPNHNPMKKGTLHGILADIASSRSTSIDALIDLL
jgi:predicted RNA binding protein YcfA (HicA-like mRNA interferase family)